MISWARWWQGLPVRERSRLCELASQKYHRGMPPVSDLEVAAIYLFDQLKLRNYVYQYAIPGTRLRADFYFPRRNLIIETYGCGYHQCPDCYPKPWKPSVLIKDKHRIARLKSLGYSVLILWGHQFGDGSAQAVLRATFRGVKTA